MSSTGDDYGERLGKGLAEAWSGHEPTYRMRKNRRLIRHVHGSNETHAGKDDQAGRCAKLGGVPKTQANLVSLGPGPPALFKPKWALIVITKKTTHIK